MLVVQAGLRVNAVVWIISPDDDDERQSTEQVFAFLEPFLQVMQIPLFKFEPQSAAELLTLIRSLEAKARGGLSWCEL
jgi:hypothetical protein